jgi:hypothetical protein
MKQEFKAEFRALLSRFASLSDGEDESLAEEEESAR